MQICILAASGGNDAKTGGDHGEDFGYACPAERGKHSELPRAGMWLLHCVIMTTQSDSTSYRYTPELANQIEKTWQQYWKDNGTFNAPNPVGELATDAGELPKEKLNVQDMFPYPSGAGLHVGHPLGYIATDTYARYNRMLGKNVLHTLGYDAFGLPAEQYAIQTGTHPRTTTEANIENMRRQLGMLGLGHDPRRSVESTDPEFFKWTQWIFLQIYNSWFDEEQQKARPIAELIKELEANKRTTKDGRYYEDLTEAQTAEVMGVRTGTVKSLSHQAVARLREEFGFVGTPIVIQQKPREKRKR